MRIAILTTSLTRGGAAIVTDRLAEALRALGNEVQTFIFHGRRDRSPSFLKEHLQIFLGNGFNRKQLFKASTAAFGIAGIDSEVLAWKPDVVVLGWINQGLISLDQICRIGSAGVPLVWVMHDMWNMTGICHYSPECKRFERECGCCPLISRPMRRPHDLSYRVWRRKMQAYNSIPKLTFVTISRWVAELAAKSSLLGGRDCRVIPNVFPLENYEIAEKEKGLIIFGAARLDDPIKGLEYAVEALNKVNPQLGAHVAFFGDIRDTAALNNLKMPYELLGSLNADEVARLCSRAEVLLSTALYETLPTTLIEGQASGAIPVSFSRGGQPDIVDHGQTGWLAQFGNTDAIARGVEWALAAPVDLAGMRESVRRKFSAQTVARQYMALFKELTAED